MHDCKPVVHIIDDDLSVGKALGRLLKSMGYEYEYFSSAEAYLEKDDKKNSSCLVLDIKLPGISGLELQQEIIKKDNQISVIFITGHGDKELEKEVIKEGAYGFLEKPFDYSLLMQLIESAISDKALK